ncbi:hypothetical protein TNCV_4764391 [Trichonephila clavipes]|nr:hypothetical protein TNCV_4764391 [Trichonephila clavipes]
MEKQFKDTRFIERKPRQDRPRTIKARKVRSLSIIAVVRDGLQLLSSILTCMQPQETLYQGWVFQKDVYERGLFARRLAVCIPFTSKIMNVHLEW